MIFLSLAILIFLPQLCFSEFTPRWDELTTISVERKQELIEKFRNEEWDAFIELAVNDDIQKLRDGSVELLLSIGILKKGFPVLSYALFTHLIEDHPTSPLVDMALEGLTEAFKTGKIETGLLQEIFDKRIVKPKSAEALATLGYHRGLTLQSKSFFKWATQELNTLPKNTFWKRYYEFMEATRKSKTVEAKELLELWSAYLKQPELSGELKQRALLNKARAQYELGQFDQSETTYKTVNLSRFDQGTVLRELGWLYYINRRYKKALGVLNQLKSSVYGMYFHTDEYLLAGLIYRETCQSELLDGLSKSLDKRLEQVKKNIKNIRPYDKNFQVFQFAIHRPNLKNRARMMTYLNDEITKADEEFSESVLRVIERPRKRLNIFTMQVINRDLIATNREAIEELLVLKDQVDYLSYSLRLRRMKGSETSYEDKTEKARKTSRKDQVVWPVYSEIWEDEITNFHSVLEMRCL